MSPAAIRCVMLARSSYIAATLRKESASAPSSSRERTVISTSGSPTASRSAARRNSPTTLPMVRTMIQHRQNLQNGSQDGERNHQVETVGGHRTGLVVGLLRGRGHLRRDAVDQVHLCVRDAF